MSVHVGHGHKPLPSKVECLDSPMLPFSLTLHGASSFLNSFIIDELVLLVIYGFSFVSISFSEESLDSALCYYFSVFNLLKTLLENCCRLGGLHTVVVAEEEVAGNLGAAEAILVTSDQDQLVEHPLLELEATWEGVVEGDSRSVPQLLHHYLI